MSLCKWSCICFLGGLILIGWPAAVSCDSSLEDKHPPGVKECRVHIEKALEQYWDKKEPEETSNSNEDNNANYLDETNEEENIRKEQRDSSHLERPDYKDDDETEDDDIDDDEENSNDEENNNDDDDTDNNEDDDDNLVTEDNEEDDNDDAEDEDDEEDTNDDAETEANTQDIENTDSNEDEEEDDDEEEAENDDEDEEEESKSEDEDNNNEDDDDDENDEESEDTNGGEQDNDEVEQTKSSTSSDENLQDDDDEEEEEVDGDDEDDNTDLHEDDENDGNETNLKEESTENEENNKDEEAANEDAGEESENNDNEAEEETEVEGSLLNESNVNKSDSSLEEQATENDKAVDEVPVKATPVEEETNSTEDTSESHIVIDAIRFETRVLTSYSEADSEQEEEDEDDSIENIYEEEEEEDEPHTYRSREHIDLILGIDEIGSSLEKEEEKMAQSVFRDIKKIETTHIKPVEQLYKYADSTTRVLGDAEIFSKPMLLFLGPWGAGKTSIINYLLGLERTPSALKTGSTGLTDVDFSLLTYGAQRRVVSGTELAADWKYAGVQKFGQGFLDHFRSIHIPHPLLQKVTIVDTPGIVENRKNADRGYSINAAFQWFIDRADAIYVVLDPSKVDIGGELGSVIEQLQGQNVRFLLNKADSIRRSDLMRVVGQLFWNLSPLLGGAEAPLIYAVSLTSHPFHPAAPAKFLADQEKNFLYDMKSTTDKRVENKILYARKHAVRVRNHAKMVDCYLASYYRTKSIFSNKRNVAKLITENPREYNIYDGLTGMTNVSRSDVPNPLAYKEFFKIHPLYDFKPLASTCSYFRGCPMDKVDLAITKEFPELLAKYKEAKRALYGHLEQDR